MLETLADEGHQLGCCRQVPVGTAGLEVSEVGGQQRQSSFDVQPDLIPVEQGANGEGVAQVVIVPTSAQPRLCRPPRYADLGAERGMSELGES